MYAFLYSLSLVPRSYVLSWKVFEQGNLIHAAKTGLLKSQEGEHWAICSSWQRKHRKMRTISSLRDIPCEVPAKSRIARAGIHGGFKGGTNCAEKNHTRLWCKRSQDLMKSFYFQHTVCFSILSHFQFLSLLCLSSFTHKSSSNNTLKSLHVRQNSTPLWVTTFHCAL